MRIEKRYMKCALKEAVKAAEEDEVPVGAVVVLGDSIIASAHNEVETSNDASAHAELIAMRRASEALGTRYLNECVLYVTMEPCCMCAGACLHYRIGAVAFGAYDDKCGAFGSTCDLGNGRYGIEIPVIGGIMRDECASILGEFFRHKRQCQSSAKPL